MQGNVEDEKVDRRDAEVGGENIKDQNGLIP